MNKHMKTIDYPLMKRIANKTWVKILQIKVYSFKVNNKII